MPANTSPDNIQFPTAGDQVAPLNTVFQNLAQTTQTALTRRIVANVADFTALAALSTTGKLAGDLAFVVEGAVYMSWTGTVWRQVTTSSFSSTGARDSAYSKAGAAYRVADVRTLNTATSIESLRSAASAWVLDYEVYTNAITARAGFTIGGQRIWRQGRVVSMALQVTKSSAFGLADVVADVNIPFLFPQAGAGSIVGAGADNANAAVRACSVGNTGQIQHLGGSGTPGTNVQQLSCTWIIA